jgi:hypothetical protein
MKKIPSSNIQAPEKLQAPSTKAAVRRAFEVWCLVLLWSLELGAWSFSFTA